MPENEQWEYLALSAGSFWHMPSDEELAGLLNQLGEEGWEVVSTFSQYGSNRVRIVAKRRSTPASRRRQSWPG